MVYFDSDYALISYHREFDAVSLKWKRYSSSSEYRQAFKKALELFVDNRAKGFISDLRGSGVEALEDAAWLSDEIIPQALSHGMAKAAYVLPEGEFKKFYVEVIQKTVDKTKLEVKRFEDLTPALQWIGGQ